MPDREPRRPRFATGPIVGVLAALTLVLGVLITSGALDVTDGRDEVASLQEYAAIALEHMRDGIHADESLYADVRARVEREVATAEAYADTYSSLTRAGQELGGEHTSFTRPAAAATAFGESETSTKNFGVVPTVRTDGGITTVTVPSFASPNAEITQEYVDRGARAIADAVQATTRGWVIDLRSNDGGNIGRCSAPCPPSSTRGRCSPWMGAAVPRSLRCAVVSPLLTTRGSRGPRSRGSTPTCRWLSSSGQGR